MASKPSVLSEDTMLKQKVFEVRKHGKWTQELPRLCQDKCFQPESIRDIFRVKALFSAAFQSFDLFRLSDVNYKDRLIFVVIVH